MRRHNQKGKPAEVPKWKEWLYKFIFTLVGFVVFEALCWGIWFLCVDCLFNAQYVSSSEVGWLRAQLSAYRSALAAAGATVSTIGVFAGPFGALSFLFGTD